MAEAALPPPLVNEPVAEVVAPPPAPPFEPEPAAVVEAALPAAPAEPWEPVAAQPQVGWEQRLGARAFVWVGAVTLALAAVFLVRYSIEEGYLSPEVRVILAALFGFALIGGAERMRSRDDRVAQALAAAGVASLYGALFSAVALYDMISKVAAGGGAAALTAFAIGVSLRHGIFVAGLAFVGGFASPAIIGSETPNTPVLFGYLLAIAAGTLWRHPPARLVAARLGRAGGSGDLDGALDDVAGGRPALGRAVPGRRGRPVRLGDLAAAGRRREPGDRRRGAGLGGARRHRRADRDADRAGRRQADRRLARPGRAWHWALRPGALDAALPVRRGPGADLVDRRTRLVAATPEQVRLGCAWRRSVRRPLRRGGLRLAVERGAAGLLGGAGRRRGARALPALPGTCCAASPTARRGA